MNNFIIFHGTNGSPEENWFPWLKAELEAKGHRVYVPALPTPEGQTVDEWMSACKTQLPSFSADNDITLIGHSAGATFLLHFLEAMDIKALRSIFISPVMDEINIEEYDVLNHSFIEHDFDWNVIKSRAGEVNVLHGDNDPYVPLEQAHRLSADLGVQTTVIKNGGHLNSESGYTDFPMLLNIF